LKTLDEVEARTILNGTNTPGDATSSFIITTPGSYYPVGNIAGTSGKHGISIQANDVALDLNGFALIGGTGLCGIHVPHAQSDLRGRRLYCQQLREQCELSRDHRAGRVLSHRQYLLSQ